MPGTGTFSAVLTVQDPAGNSGTETVWVVVNDKPAVSVTPMPAPTAIPTANPTSTIAPENSSSTIPALTWLAAIAAAAIVLGAVIGILLLKKKTSCLNNSKGKDRRPQKQQHKYIQ